MIWTLQMIAMHILAIEHLEIPSPPLLFYVWNDYHQKFGCISYYLRQNTPFIAILNSVCPNGGNLRGKSETSANENEASNNMT